MNENKSWIEVSVVIDKRREFENMLELNGDGSYHKKLADFIKNREERIKEEEPELIRRRQMLDMAKQKKNQQSVIDERGL